MNGIRRYFSLELLFWIIALVYLAAVTPGEPHFSFCVWNHFGISWCPGCGIGRSVSYLLHGDIVQSVQSHVLGTFALCVIVYRVFQLTIYQYKSTKNQNHGESIHSS